MTISLETQTNYGFDLSKGLNKWESPLSYKTADFVDVSAHAFVIGLDEPTTYTSSCIVQIKGNY